jgi:hypothetical protein
MKNIRIFNESNKFHKRRQELLLQERQYARLHKEKEDVEEKQKKLTEQNQEIADNENIIQHIKDTISSKFFWLVVLLDYCLAYVVLASYTEFIPFIPVAIKAFLAICILTGIEHIMAIFIDADNTPPNLEETENTFAYNEANEQKILKYEHVQKRSKFMSIVRHLFLLVLPFVSLATMFQEIGLEYMAAGFEEESNFSSAMHNAQLLFIIFKYSGLAICSWISHLILSTFTEQISNAKGRIDYKNKFAILTAEIEKLGKSIEQLENSIIKALMDFHQELKKFLLRFGPNDMTPSESFSPMLDDLYLRVNGKKLTSE